jgi:hypothetical protein
LAKRAVRTKSGPKQPVKAVFDSYPASVRRHLLSLRKLIFETAAETEGVGEPEETLKWGEPAYLTSQSKSGSTIRLGWKASRPAESGLYFNCQITLVDSFPGLFPHELELVNNRAIVLRDGEPIPRGSCKPVSAWP